MALARQICGCQLLHQSYNTLSALCSSLIAVLHPQKIAENRKEDEQFVENLVFDVTAALRPCYIVKQCVLRLPCETQKFVR